MTDAPSPDLGSVLAAVLAFAQSDLKRLLAWSTVSQVGIMLAALAAARAAADGMSVKLSCAVVDSRGDLYVCQWASGSVYPYKLHRLA